MFTRNLLSFVCILSACLSFNHFKFSILKKSKVLYSSNSDIFSSSPKIENDVSTEKTENISPIIINTKDEKQQKMIDEAAKLRREAAEMEGMSTIISF